jgi:hypothetical protein
MSKIIFKYQLSTETILELPEGAEVLAVHEQRDEVCMWVLLDGAHLKKEFRKFVTVPTGKTLPYGNWKFLGTSLLRGGYLVFHTFEVL